MALIWASCGGDPGGALGGSGDKEVVSLQVLPSNLTIVPGANRRFVVLGEFSDGTSGPPAVTWTATGGTVSTEGDYRAGQSPGLYRVMATEMAGLADSASVTIQAPPPTQGITDVTQLPVAVGQAPNIASWNALDVPGLAAGGSYLDPVTGVRVWKLTSTVVPEPNTGAGHDYGDGPVQVSREWGGGVHTVLVRTSDVGYWLVDVERGVGLRNWRRIPNGAAPGGDLHWTFSNNPLTPQIAYSFTGDQLVRVNTATGQIENTGGFPKALGPGFWLQQDRNDEWFVKLNGTAGVVAWNSQTGVTLTRSFSGLDEPHLERDGRYVALITEDGVRVWDLQTDQLSPAFSDAPFAHNASPRGHFVAVDVDESAPWTTYRLDPQASGGAPTLVDIQSPALGVYYHAAGSWIQDGPLESQWTVWSTYNRGPGVPAVFPGTPGIMDSRSLLQSAVGYLRSDGSDVRLLCHTYQLYDQGDYWELPRATASPDGKVVIFDSDMQNSGRYDLFLVEVPLDPTQGGS